MSSLGTPKNAILCFLVLAMTVLAGCSSKGTEAVVAPPEDTAGPAAVDKTTGGIEGFAVDDEKAGVANVDIAILDLNLETSSDMLGAFTFSLVPPGTHTLYASRAGFDPKPVSVTVAAGEVTRGVEIELNPIIDPNQPYTYENSGNGILGCGASVRVTDVAPGVNACGLFPDGSEFNQNVLTFEIQAPITRWEGAVFEMTWQSTQAAGRALNMIWDVNGCSFNAEDDGKLVNVVGDNPLRVYLGAEDLARLLKLEAETCTDLDGGALPKDCDEEACTIILRVFSGDGAVGVAPEADAGVTTFQSFTGYITAWFNHAPADAEQYSAVQD